MSIETQKEVINNLLSVNKNITFENLKVIFENNITLKSSLNYICNKYSIDLCDTNDLLINFITKNKFNTELIKSSLEYLINNKETNVYLKDDCPICLDELNTDYTILDCGHKFHTNCLKESFAVNKSCPYCRNPISELTYNKYLWNALINIIYFNQDISLLKYILRNNPELGSESFNKNYEENSILKYDYSITKAFLDSQRFDVMMYMVREFNYNFISNILDFTRIFDKKYLENELKIHQYDIITILKNPRCEYDYNFHIYDVKLFLKLLSIFETIYTDFAIILDLVIRFIPNNIPAKEYVLVYLINYSNISDFEKYLNKLHTTNTNIFSILTLESILKMYNTNRCDGVFKYKNSNLNFIIKMKKFCNLLKKNHIQTNNNLINNINYKYIIHNLAKINDGYKIMKILNSINSNIKIDFSAKDESEFTPLLDCARHGCINTFKYIEKKTDSNVFHKGYTENTYNLIDNYNLLTASLINKDNRIFKYLLENYDKYQEYFNVSEYENNIINIFENIPKISYSEKYKRIKFLLELLKIKNKDYFNALFTSVYLKLDTKTVYKLYNDFKDARCHNMNYYSIINDMDHHWVFDDSINYILLKKIDEKNALILIKDIIRRKCYCHQSISILKKYCDFKNIDFKVIVELFSESYSDNNTPNECACKEKCFEKFVLDFKTHGGKLDQDKLLYDLNRNYYSYKNKYELEKFSDFKRSTLILNGAKISFDYKNLSGNCYNWIKVKCALIRYIRKKYKKINHEIKSETISYIESKLQKLPNPVHIQPEDFMRINAIDCTISEKADGITQRYFMENLNLEPHYNFNNYSLEVEYVEELNIYFIFNISNKYLNYEDMYFQLRFEHKFINNVDDVEELTFDNYCNYITKEKKLLDKYVGYLKENNKTGWWPKKLWNFKSKDKLNELRKIINSEMEPVFKNDGWIINEKNNEKIYKLKPFNHMTVDLRYFNPNTNYYPYNSTFKWSVNKSIGNYSVYEISNFLEEGVQGIHNGVYRCYWNSEISKWIPKEYRKEKKQPNSFDVFKKLTRHNIYKWNINDILEVFPKINPYYNFLNKKSSKNNLDQIKKYLLDNYIYSVLDIGCGYQENLIVKWTGVDIDLHAINHQKRHYPDQKWIWSDFTANFNNNIQKDILTHNLYNYINYGNKFDESYNCIMLINCIHYYENNEEKWINLNNNILSKSNADSKLIIRFLDKTKLMSLFNNTDIISNPKDNSYVKLISDNQIELYYEWNHSNPKIEYLVDENIISKFEQFGWYVEDVLENKELNSSNNWNNYFNCFKTIVFKYI